MKLDSPLTELPGIGAVRGEKLKKLGLNTVGDLLGCFPRGYEDRRQVYPVQSAPLGQKVCVCAMVADRPQLARIPGGMELVRVRAVDHSGSLYITFFHQTYVEKVLKPGDEYIFYGTVEEQEFRRRMNNPVFELAGNQEHTGRIFPVYPLTAGLSNHMLCSWMERALAACGNLIPETLPPSVRLEHTLAQAEYAYQNIHFPENVTALEQAKRRLSFEELFYLSIGLSHLKNRRKDTDCAAVIAAHPVSEFSNLLPFSLTGAQIRSMEEIGKDLASGKRMNRLVQGDVGSGKTMVAAYSIWLTWRSGRQSALMAPTEVLAQQHHQNLSVLFEPLGLRVVLLTGAMSAKGKRDVRERLELGMAHLVIGTHALLSEGVLFRDLGLVVTDEQHRFGVAQRAALAAKSRGIPPHVLVMSATPIPRTLALIIYGDLDISVIDELPPGRTPIETYVVGEDKRHRMYNFVRKLVGEGRQAYIICPAVEETEENPDSPIQPPMDLKAVKVYAKELQEQIFPELRVDFLHGKMRPKEKDRVMSAFAAGETDVLVSTTVVEVGVDVPNAALIIIENAERFGLSQLHQLRGRVGRGQHQSYCVLITPSRGETVRQRLKTLAGTTDGFKISEEDLKQRGPGDFFGSRQHGLPTLKMADLAGDMRTLNEAQQAARKLLEEDPNLEQPENRPVLERVREMFYDIPDIFN